MFHIEKYLTKFLYLILLKLENSRYNFFFSHILLGLDVSDSIVFFFRP